MVQISLQNSGGKVVFLGGSMVTPPWAPTGVKVLWSLLSDHLKVLKQTYASQQRGVELWWHQPIALRAQYTKTKRTSKEEKKRRISQMHFYVILKSLPISDDRGPSSFEGTSTVLRLKFMYVSSFDSINIRTH